MSVPGTRKRRRWTVSFGAGSEWSPAQIVLTVLTGTALALFLLLARVAHGDFDPLWWVLAFVPLVSAGWAGSLLPLGYWGAALVLWYQLSPEGTFSLWAVPAAITLLVGHACTALSATLPPSGTPSRASIRRWARRVAWVSLTAPAVAIPAAALSTLDHGGNAAAYVIGVLGLTAGVFLLRSVPPDNRD